jgi:hypothetical protein
LLRVALSFLVGAKSFLGNLGLLVCGGVFSDVTEEVGLHLVEEHLGLVAVGVRH